MYLLKVDSIYETPVCLLLKNKPSIEDIQILILRFILPEWLEDLKDWSEVTEIIKLIIALIALVFVFISPIVSMDKFNQFWPQLITIGFAYGLSIGISHTVT